MPYLLSLLGTESSVEGSENLLCYYINDAANIQIIRLMDGAMCLSEHITFSGEGILFTALPESYLEIYSPRINRTKVSIISCNRLRINEVSNLTKSSARKYSNPKGFTCPSQSFS